MNNRWSNQELWKGWSSYQTQFFLICRKVNWPWSRWSTGMVYLGVNVASLCDVNSLHVWSKLSPSLQPLSGVFLVVVPINFPTSEVKYSHCVQLVSQMLCHSWLYFHANRQLWWLDRTRVEHLAFILAFKFYSHHFRLIHMVNACRLYFSLREHSYTKVWLLVWELEWGTIYFKRALLIRS